jgi:hypothetical protein
MLIRVCILCRAAQRALEAAAAAARLESGEEGAGDADIDGSYAEGGYSEDGLGTQQGQEQAVQVESLKPSVPLSARSQRSSNADRPVSSGSKASGGGQQTARSNVSSASLGKGSAESRKQSTGATGVLQSGRASVASDTSSAIDGRSRHSTPSHRGSDAGVRPILIHIYKWSSGD